MSNSDLQLARVLLRGFVDQDSRGKVELKYLEDGTSDELGARRALARLLRGQSGDESRLDRELLRALASLFDPDPPEWEERTIKLDFRSRGRRADPAAATQVAEYIWNKVSNERDSVSGAIVAAVDVFHISEEMVKKIWGRYRPLLEQIYGPLPSRTTR